MSTNNDNGDGGKQSQGRYVYQAYQTLPAVTSVEDFAKRMLNIVARGNSDQHHKQFLTNKLNQIGSIVHRQNQGWQISYDEKMTLLLAETWCLNHMMNSLSTQSRLSAGVLKKQQTKATLTKHLILSTLLAAICDESIVFWQEAAKVIIDHTKLILNVMNTKDYSDEEGKYAERFRSSRIGIKLSEMEDRTRPLDETHALLIEELWNPDLEKQIKISWKPVLSYLQKSLPPEWSIALDKDYYITMVYDILTENDQLDTTQLKCVFLKAFSKAVMAIMAGKVILGLQYGKIKHELEKSAAWTPKLEFEAFWWFVKNWPDYFDIFVGSMRKFLDARHYRMMEHLGLRLFLIGYCTHHAPVSFDHLGNKTKFIKNLFRVQQYKIASQITQWDFPKCIRKHQVVMQHIFEENMSDDKISAKTTCYPIPMAIVILSDHYSKIVKAYGTGRYKNNEGLTSRVVNADSLHGSWGTIMDNYVEDNYPLTLQDMEDMYTSIDNLHTAVPKYQPKLIFGISRKVKELHDQGLRYTNDNGVCLGESDETINSGKMDGNKASSSDTDSQSALPPEFREPLQSQTKRKLSQSKTAALRHQKIVQRQQLQAITRVLCALLSFGFAEVLSLDWFESYVRHKINSHVLEESITNVVSNLETSCILLMFSLGALHVDYMINHFKYAMDILWNSPKCIFKKVNFWLQHQMIRLPRGNGYKRDIDFVDKFATAFSDGEMIGRWSHFNLNIPDFDYCSKHAWNNLGEQKESMGWWSLMYWFTHTFLDYEICSRVQTGVAKGRAVHAPRELKLEEQIHDFFEEAFMDDEGFLHAVILDTCQLGVTNNNHLKAEEAGFGGIADVYVPLSDMIENKMEQYQFTQHKIALQLLFDALTPLLPYLLPKRLCFDHRNLGGVGRDMQTCFYAWTKLFYYKKAHQRNFNNRNKNNNNTAHKPLPAATPDEKIMYTQEHGWAMFVASWSNKKIPGTQQLQPCIRQCIDNSITIPPISCAPQTFSKYHIERCLNPLLFTDKNRSNKNKVVRQMSLDENSKVHSDGLHRDNTDEDRQVHEGKVNILLAQQNMNFNDQTAVKIYSPKFYTQDFWHCKDRRKQSWKNSKTDHVKNGQFEANNVCYGEGWEYQFDSQYDFCQSTKYQQCIPVFKKCNIDFPENTVLSNGPGAHDSLYSMTSSDTEEDEQSNEGSNMESMDACASVSVVGDAKEDDDDDDDDEDADIVTEGMNKLNLQSEEDDNSGLSDWDSLSEESDSIDVAGLSKVSSHKPSKEERKQQSKEANGATTAARTSGRERRTKSKSKVTNKAARTIGSRRRTTSKSKVRSKGRSKVVRTSGSRRRTTSKSKVANSSQQSDDDDDEPRISGISNFPRYDKIDSTSQTKSKSKESKISGICNYGTQATFNQDKFANTSSFANLSMSTNVQNDNKSGDKRNLQFQNKSDPPKKRRKICTRPNIQANQSSETSESRLQRKRNRRRRKKNIPDKKND